jgi:hypothetical protein
VDPASLHKTEGEETKSEEQGGGKDKTRPSYGGGMKWSEVEQIRASTSTITQ